MQSAPRPRLLALLVFHNEMRYLPGWFENVLPHVDGVVALDDGSTDGSGDFVAAQPGVLEVVRVPPREPHVWDDGVNHSRVIEAALRHQPDWMIGLDADERLEREFRTRAEEEIRRAEKKGYKAYTLQLYELWDSPRTYRV
ncbi:MAG TPA: glycosyltransferase family 2 protein, partial [Thermoanaerobaculia bacterium]|nr:glycosyltransferase family 2 protein [Thermoanaerobaculia bacterium]